MIRLIPIFLNPNVNHFKMQEYKDRMTIHKLFELSQNCTCLLKSTSYIGNVEDVKNNLIVDQKLPSSPTNENPVPKNTGQPKSIQEIDEQANNNIELLNLKIKMLENQLEEERVQKEDKIAALKKVIDCQRDKISQSESSALEMKKKFE